MFACAKPIMGLAFFLLMLPALLLALGGGHAAAASVTQVNQVAKLISSDAVAYDFFGVAVAIDGDTLLVGANGDDDHGSASGAAYVFVRSNGVWVQQAKLTPNDGAVDDEFGRYVALAGNTALIGSHWHDARGANSGAAYVFVRNGTSWTQQAKLTASDAAAGDEFGWGLAIEGDLALVGAPYNDARGTDSGALYAFVRSGTSWTQQAKLTASDGDADDRFGWFLALNSGTAVVGALADEAKGFASGSAYVFTYNGSSWSQQAKLTASDGAGNDQFGAAVAVHRDTAVISAIENDAFGTNSGAAYVFVRNGTSWTQQAKLNATDAAAGDKFGGWGVAIQYDVAVVGSAFSDSSAVDTGAVYVFARNGTNWSQQRKVVASDPGMGDLFGWSVALSGNRVVTGGHANDDSGVDSGSAYVFDATILAAISGTVTDSSGNGVTGVTISTSGGSTTTGSNGAYTLSGLTTGSYTLTPAKTSCTFTPASRLVTVPPDGSTQTFSATCTTPTYAIAGTITNSNGTGVAGVMISDGTRSTTTDSNGYYTLSGMTAGSYTLTPSRSGYSFSPTTRSVTVSGNVSGQDFVGTALTYSISGRVTDSSNNGLSGVSVSGVGSTTTDSNGNYTLSGVPAGSYTLTPSLNGYSFSPTTRSVSVNGNVSGQDFTGTAIVSTFSVSGRVTDSNGATLVSVTLSNGIGSTTTDSNGNYTLNGVPAGSYTLTPSLNGYSFSPTSRSVSVSGNVNGQDFTGTAIVSTFSVSGRVTDSSNHGLSGVSVSGIGSTTTDSNGNYTLNGVPAGNYTLTPSLNGYSFSPTSRSVTVSGNVSGQDFTANPNTYSIAGRVTASNTSAIAEVLVSAGTGKTARTDSNGNYSIQGLVAGTYALKPLTNGCVFTPASRTVSVSTNIVGQDFTQGLCRQYLPFVIGKRAGNIVGQVVSAITGQPLVGATVCMLSTNRCVTTNSQGGYTFTGVAIDSQILRASAIGYTTLTQSAVGQDSPTITLNFALSPYLAQGEMRIVLTWNTNPRDLDSHLWLPSTRPYEVYWRDKGACFAFPYACLDVDDIMSYGPETVTIRRRYNGKYSYAVHLFAGTGSLATSGARVWVYDANGFVASYAVPTSGQGRWWYVFDLDGATGTLTPRNYFSQNSPDTAP